MLVLSREGDAYPDDADEGIRYRLPADLRALAGADGIPQVALSRGPDGGLLHLRLAPRWPALRAGEKPVPFAGGRFRLLLRTPTASEQGRWHEAATAGEAIVDRSLSLDPVEVAIARRLGAAGDEIVDVEVEAEIRGFAPIFPWRVRAQTDAVRARLAGLLGPSPVPWNEVEDAFLGLGRDAFTWYPLEPGALPPPTDEALLAIAVHSAPFLLAASEAGWALGEGAPERLDLSLAVPRLASRTIGLRWSFSDFLARQPDPGRHLTELQVPAPFEAADLLAVNDVPLAESGIRSIAVEVKTGGPTGRVRHEFLPGEPAAARLRFVRETFEEPEISWRAKMVVSTPRGTAVKQTEFRSTGLLIEIRPETIGLVPLRFTAEAELFATVEALEIAVGSRTLTLTAAAPEAWAVGRRPPPAVGVTARLAGGRSEPLGSLAITAQGLSLTASLLGRGEVVPVLLRPPAGAEHRVAYLAVQVEGGPWRSLEADGEISWPVRRDSRFDPPRLRYRTRRVPRGAGGATEPMTESDWVAGEGEVVEVEV